MWIHDTKKNNRALLSVHDSLIWSDLICNKRGYLFPSGGLAEEVDEKVLHAAFIPFGDIIDIQIPLDYETGKMSSFHLNLNVL